MAGIDAYLDKFDESGKRVLEGALNETRRRNQHYISPAHIVYALMTEETELFNAMMKLLSIDPQEIRLAVEKRLENSYQSTIENFRIAPETTDIFKSSMDKARSENRRIISANDICFALANRKYYGFNYILQNS